MQLTLAQLEAIGAALIATDGPFDPAAIWLGVGTAISPSGLNTALSDITQATGAMATRKSLTAWVGPFVDGQGLLVYNGPLMTFKPASSAEDQTLAVWFLADSLTTGNLLGYGMILPPVVLPDETKSWSIVMRLTIDSRGVWSTEVSFVP
jgi:hypothetical protein